MRYDFRRYFFLRDHGKFARTVLALDEPDAFRVAKRIGFGAHVEISLALAASPRVFEASFVGHLAAFVHTREYLSKVFPYTMRRPIASPLFVLDPRKHIVGRAVARDGSEHPAYIPSSGTPKGIHIRCESFPGAFNGSPYSGHWRYAPFNNSNYGATYTIAEESGVTVIRWPQYPS